MCQKKFARSNVLAVHKRLHTGEQPYECGSCHMKFGDLSNLMRHKRVRT